MWNLIMWVLMLLSATFFFGGSVGKNERFFENGMAGECQSTVEEFPFVAQIWKENLHKKRYNYLCAAAIISNYWIVTTGDCMLTKSGDRVSSRNMYITTGGPYSSTNGKYSVRHITIHPYYSNATGVNNIALLRTKTGLVYSSNLLPADTAVEGDQDRVYNNHCTLVRGPILRQIPTFQIGLRMCRSLHRNKLLQLNDTKNMCSYDRNRARVACGEWAGGALLVCGDIYNRKLFGLLQYSPKYQGDWPHCIGHTDPEVYTMISGYHDWIEAVICK